MENNVEEQEALTKLGHHIPASFSEAVLREAERTVQTLSGCEPEREDLRAIPLVTIDGADARDFDDAVFVEKKGQGWRLLVAIADVSFFVRPRTRLDLEARARGNSCYFPCSVEPMLPEALSNGVCSLRPGEDRLVMAVDVELNGRGHPVAARFYPGLMRSQARLTYTAVQTFLDQGEDPVADFSPSLGAMLHDAAALAEVLMARRKNQGGLDFGIPEAEFVVEAGRVNDVRNKERLFSHRLIEAFMVEANEAVARFLSQRKIPALYRVHPAPQWERLHSLLQSLFKLPCNPPLPLPSLKKKKADSPQDWLPPLLRAVEDQDCAWLVNTLTLRSMMQARYDPEPDIHFGLASACYCHFTSPIRRYADLMVHRALKHSLGLDMGGTLPRGKRLLDVAEICNTRERVAQSAEREITRRMGCLVLRGREGEGFQGVISGVTAFGLFVQLDGKPLEGLVRMEKLGDDYFHYHQDRQELRGARSRQSFRLGDTLAVRLSDVNVDRLEINLDLAQPLLGFKKKGHKKKSKKKFKAQDIGFDVENA